MPFVHFLCRILWVLLMCLYILLHSPFNVCLAILIYYQKNNTAKSNTAVLTEHTTNLTKNRILHTSNKFLDGWVT